jgi:predicted DNA binding CopG/RHH family protein
LQGGFLFALVVVVQGQPPAATRLRSPALAGVVRWAPLSLSQIGRANKHFPVLSCLGAKLLQQKRKNVSVRKPFTKPYTQPAEQDAWLRLRCPEKLLRAVEQRAKRERSTLSAFVRAALYEKLKKADGPLRRLAPRERDATIEAA